MRNHTALLDHPVGFAGAPRRGPFGSAGRLFDPMTALIVGGTSLLGGAIAGHASESAADTQSNAANRATDLQQQNLAQTRQSLQPFINSGYDAQTSLRNMMGLGAPTDAGSFGSLTKPFGAAEFSKYQDPGYQFQLQQGQQALQNSQAAQNGVLGGAALKDLIGYNQGMANNAYQNAFGRYMSQNDATYNRLSSLLNLGQNSAAGVGNMSAQVTSNIGNTMMSGANAQAAGQVGQANAYSSGLNSIGSMYMMNQLLAKTPGATGGVGAGFGNSMDAAGNGAAFAGYA